MDWFDIDNRRIVNICDTIYLFDETFLFVAKLEAEF